MARRDIVHDANFKGDPGNYIVKLRFSGSIFTEKIFGTRVHNMPIFTIDPKAHPPHSGPGPKR